MHIQRTVLDSQHLALHFFSCLLSILYNGGGVGVGVGNGVSWKRDTELVTIQGEEPRSLRAGQFCPAGVPAEALIQGVGLVVP